jgi:hypothetical protein
MALGEVLQNTKKTSRVMSFEPMSSNPEESDHSKSDTEMHPTEIGVGSDANIEVPSVDQPEKIVDVTFLSPSGVVGATLADPLDIDYSEPEHESDEDCAAQSRSSKDKTPVPPPLAVKIVVSSPAEAPSGRKVVSATHHKTLTRVEHNDGSSSETESDTWSGGVFVSNLSPSVVAQRLGMKPSARIFGDSM